ncbi:MAG: allantoicase, partial [Myxococcales bacterium]|nr:allantoicase [Myxococcales bacterium]
SDDFFAEVTRMLNPEPAQFVPGKFDTNGKWMDGWESRRKRVPGHDWCVVRLGVRGSFAGVDIDTSHFLGNHPPFASLDAADTTDEEVAAGTVRWTRVLPSVPLRRGSHNLQPIRAEGSFTHVRLNIYPDGGVARLRVYGTPDPVAQDGRIDLAALHLGGRPLACSDMFFSPMTNLLLPGRSTYMGGGWETRRSRPPGEDWIIVALGAPGLVEEVLLDTGHFKGNYPDRAVVEGLWWPDAPPQALIGHADWRPATPKVRLRADAEHRVSTSDRGPYTHLRLRIFPDGGVARMRAFGVPARPEGHDPLLHHLARSSDAELLEQMSKCCGSRRWAEAMVALRPFSSRTQLFGMAEQAWWHLADEDWKEAFTHHPRIGEDPEALRRRFASTATWSAGEQAGMVGADEETLAALAEGNRAYEARFGHVFLICATGLSAATMLEELRARLPNDPAAELRIAAGEQVKITALRLGKLA